MLTSYAHLLLSRPSIPNSKVFPSRLLALHLFIFRVSESHLLSTSSLPSCLPSVTCSLSPRFSADSAHTIRQLSGRQIWRINSVPFSFFFFFYFGWLLVVLGLIPFPLCPPLLLMWGIGLTHHSEKYQWLQLLETVAGVPHGLEGCWKAASQFSLSGLFLFFFLTLWMRYLGNCYGVMDLNRCYSEFAGEKAHRLMLAKYWKRISI